MMRLLIRDGLKNGFLPLGKGRAGRGLEAGSAARTIPPLRPSLRRRGNFIFLNAVILTGSLHAAWVLEDRSHWSIGLEGGASFATGSPAPGRDYSDGNVFGIRVRQDLSERWAAALSFSSLQHNEEQITTQKITAQPLMLFGQMSYLRTARWNPYLAAGLGISRNTRHVFSVDETHTKGAAALGGGLEWSLPPITTFGVEALYRYFGTAASGEDPFAAVTVAATMNFYIPDSWIPHKPAKPLVFRDPVRGPREELLTRENAQTELSTIRQKIAANELAPVTFAPGSTELLPASFETLDAFGTVFTRYPKLKIRVEAHTFESGEDAQNLILSQQRAEAARDYLLKNTLLSPANFNALGVGNTQPVVDPSTPDARLKNERVEFVIIGE